MTEIRAKSIINIIELELSPNKRKISPPKIEKPDYNMRAKKSQLNT